MSSDQGDPLPLPFPREWTPAGFGANSAPNSTKSLPAFPLRKGLDFRVCQTAWLLPHTHAHAHGPAGLLSNCRLLSQSRLAGQAPTLLPPPQYLLLC